MQFKGFVGFLVPSTSKLPVTKLIASKDRNKIRKWQNAGFWAKKDEKEQSQKIVKQVFGSESIQNVLKRILIRKSRNRKFFPTTKSFRGNSHF